MHSELGICHRLLGGKDCWDVIQRYLTNWAKYKTSAAHRAGEVAATFDLGDSAACWFLVEAGKQDSTAQPGQGSVIIV
jgi:hypothetical protein